MKCTGYYGRYLRKENAFPPFHGRGMKTVAYLRVSTGSQDLAHQKLAVLDYARQKRFAIDRFVEVQVSSRKGPDRRRIEELFGALEAGDRLVVSELSRLGRSLGQVIQLVDELVRRKIRFVAIKEDIRFEGKQDLTRHEVGPRNPDTKFGRYLFLCHLVAVRHRQAHNVLTADLRRRLATHLAALLIRNDPLVQLRIEHHIHGLHFMNNPDVMISIV